MHPASPAPRQVYTPGAGAPSEPGEALCSGSLSPGGGVQAVQGCIQAWWPWPGAAAHINELEKPYLNALENLEIGDGSC